MLLAILGIRRRRTAYHHHPPHRADGYAILVTGQLYTFTWVGYERRIVVGANQRLDRLVVSQCIVIGTDTRGVVGPW
jgi:hypothetical protein